MATSCFLLMPNFLSEGLENLSTTKGILEISLAFYNCIVVFRPQAMRWQLFQNHSKLKLKVSASEVILPPLKTRRNTSTAHSVGYLFSESPTEFFINHFAMHHQVSLFGFEHLHLKATVRMPQDLMHHQWLTSQLERCSWWMYIQLYMFFSVLLVL